MPASLIVGRAVPAELLALRVQLDGVLTDAYEATFEVFDSDDVSILSGDSTAGTGHFATGSYAVFDESYPDFDDGLWIPENAIPLGTVVWSWRPSAGAPLETVVRRFEVLVETTSKQPESVYALVGDVRALGALGATDRQLRDGAILWRHQIDRYCRQSFCLTSRTRRLSGNGSRVLYLSEPLFGLASMRRNSGTTDDSVSDYYIQGATGLDRHNPQIQFVETDIPNILATFGRSSVFDAGLGQNVTGVWGFVESDSLEAPPMIQDAAARGVFLSALGLDAGSPVSSSPGGPIAREETDQHAIQYGFSAGKMRGGMMALLRDPLIRDVLDLYRGPIMIECAANRWN